MVQSSQSISSGYSTDNVGLAEWEEEGGGDWEQPLGSIQQN